MFSKSYGAGLLVYLLMYFPGFYALVSASFALNKCDTFQNAMDLLGHKMGRIKNKKNLRLLFAIPLYSASVCSTILYMVFFGKLIILNSFILIASVVLIIVFERKIAVYNNMKGIYEKGMIYKKGAFIYDEIPEIELREDGLEILNQKGMREVLKLDDAALSYLSGTLFCESKKLTNDRWFDNKTYTFKPSKNGKGF